MAGHGRGQLLSQSSQGCCAELPVSIQSSVGLEWIEQEIRSKQIQFFHRIEFNLVREEYPPGYPEYVVSPDDLCKVIEFIRNKVQEHFVAVYMNAANEVIAVQVITVGLLNSSQVHPREAFRPALMLDCHSVVFAHNHPSGKLTPSESDIQITNQLVEVGRILGISVLDHIIISHKGYLSMKEKGYM